MRKSTTELEVGDIVLHGGMRILIDGPAHITPEHGSAALPVYRWPGLVLNADELCDKSAPAYDAYIARHLRGIWWEDRVPRPRRDNWNITGNAMALWHMGAPWRELDSLYEGTDDCGGDIQTGNIFSRRFTHTKLPGRLFEVIAYPIKGDGSTPTPDEDAPIRLEVQTRMTVCRDVEEPGSTETWSDTEYSDLPERFDHDFDSVKKAEAHARAMIRSFDLDRHIGWSGNPGMEI